ncbi:hypothetical protein, conserved [Plasmodium gonderi]|uniref:Uncharacterized protein n=1 Tax=Plasmodium gonderi TaxID=77519 RepID=A0A1Y1JN81_PLAGO|nr:hypothetical protein, conserved [Plasmodium gonderi]GAW83710.1 hypothetical protein, conserved [Plasmodium gonderi]
MRNNYSLISQILTEAEIMELGLHGSVMKHCSSPHILNKKYFIKICIYYLLSTFLFFLVYITIFILVLTSEKTELNKTIILVIYVYVFIFFYIDLIISNNIQYDLVKRYNIREVRKRIYENFLATSEGAAKDVLIDTGEARDVLIDTGEARDVLIDRGAEGRLVMTDAKEILEEVAARGDLKKNGKVAPHPVQINKRKEKIKKLFTNEKYYFIEDDGGYDMDMRHGERRRGESREVDLEDWDEKFYHLRDLRDVNECINDELMRYIQYDNNNYTIDSYRYDIFLIISGFINQLNILFDLLFLFYVYDYSQNLFFVCLFVYFYYLVHFVFLIKYSITMIQSLLVIYRKSLWRSYKKVTTLCTYCMSSVCHRLYNQPLNDYKPKLFFNKYTSYNSWSLFYTHGNSTSRKSVTLKMLKILDTGDDTQWMISNESKSIDSIINIDDNIQLYYPDKGKMKKIKQKKKKIYIKKNKIKDMDEKSFIRKEDHINRDYSNVNQQKNECELALLPSYVQIIADMSFFLSHYHILNIIKNKFLSAKNVYNHMNFTLIFFVWKILYMDVVLFLLKFFILFYTNDILAISFFLIISLTNIANSYIINLVDNNLMNDISSN